MKQTLKDNFTKFRFRWEYFLVLLLVTEVIIFGFLNPNFFKPRILFGSINDFISIEIGRAHV